MKELAKGTILIDDMLFEQGVRPSLALFVPVGKRAVNVKISKEAALGGFARQNDHVDLLAVFDNKQNFDTPQIRLIATDAEVLSINSEFLIPGRPVPPQDPKQKDKQKQNLEEGKVVAEKIVVSATLIMSPEEAEKVVLASDIAKLYMVLRSPFENKDEYMQPVTQRDLVEMKRSELISMYGELLNMKLGEINNSEKLEDAKIKKIEVYKGAKLETGAASAVPAGGSK